MFKVFWAVMYNYMHFLEKLFKLFFFYYLGLSKMLFDDISYWISIDDEFQCIPQWVCDCHFVLWLVGCRGRSWAKCPSLPHTTLLIRFVLVCSMSLRSVRWLPYHIINISCLHFYHLKCSCYYYELLQFYGFPFSYSFLLALWVFLITWSRFCSS